MFGNFFGNSRKLLQTSVTGVGAAVCKGAFVAEKKEIRYGAGNRLQSFNIASLDITGEALKQASCIRMPRGGKHLLDPSLFNRAAGVHHRRPVCNLRYYTHVVCNE